jgi:Bacterial DNA-binding protein
VRELFSGSAGSELISFCPKKTKEYAARTSAQFEISMPAIDVFWLNYSMGFIVQFEGAWWRMGRNPATGQQIHIKASKKVAFRALAL